MDVSEARFLEGLTRQQRAKIRGNLAVADHSSCQIVWFATAHRLWGELLTEALKRVSRSSRLRHEMPAVRACGGEPGSTFDGESDSRLGSSRTTPRSGSVSCIGVVAQRAPAPSIARSEPQPKTTPDRHAGTLHFTPPCGACVASIWRVCDHPGKMASTIRHRVPSFFLLPPSSLLLDLEASLHLPATVLGVAQRFD